MSLPMSTTKTTTNASAATTAQFGIFVGETLIEGGFSSREEATEEMRQPYIRNEAQIIRDCYHPNLDGPAEPYAATIDGDGNPVI